MFALILLLIIFFPLSLFSCALKNWFSPEDLTDMGVCLEKSH